MKLLERDEMQKLNFTRLFNEKITNQLDTYCRYILKGVNVGEYKVNDGFNHDNVIKVAIKNGIEFDIAMLYYKYVDLEEYIFDFYENMFGSYGRNKSGEKEYLIDHKTNLDMACLNYDPNLRVISSDFGRVF